MVKQFTFRVIDKLIRWHQNYRTEKLMKELHFCGGYGLATRQESGERTE